MPLRLNRFRPFAGSQLAIMLVVSGAACFAGKVAEARQSTLPAIADSPTAQALFDDARAQSKDNPAEAARLARRLLDEYGEKVLRVGLESEGRFVSVADETERFLLASPEVLARFREMESRAAELMLADVTRADAGVYATAARRRLTRAGLVATLRLAEQLVQADRAEAALSMISRVSRHPDLATTDAVGFGFIEAVAAARVGENSRRDRALARLAELEAAGVVGAADAARVARSTLPNDRDAGARTPLVVGPSVEAPTAEWQQVWELPLERTLFRRIFESSAGRINPRTVDAARTSANWMTSVPVVLGDRVFVNEGEDIRAIDIDSRDEIWSRPLGMGGMEREFGAVGDMAGIAVDEGALVTYEGHAFSNMRNAPSRVWCLDPRNGAVRWSIDLDSHEDRAELAGLFPVGTPLLLSDVVVVAARKPTQRLEQVDWLIGLDRRDGSVRWATSIAGAPGTRAIAGRRQAGMDVDGEAVIVGTPLGVIARVRALDGAIEWLRRTPVPLNEPPFGAEPWELGGPVVVGDRVVSIAADDTEIVALDRATGTLLETRPIGPGTSWSSPRYLLPIQSDASTPIVLGVGNDIVAFDARDLSKRLWTLSNAVDAFAPARAGVGNRLGIRGRVSSAGGLLLVPGVEDYLVVDARSGAIVARIPEQKPGNAVMLADRIVAVGDESVRVLMPPSRAEEILRARLAASPDDPGAAIALLGLAKRTGRWTIALESARAAQSALARGKSSEALRTELMNHLIELASLDPAEGDAAYEVITAIADSPKLRVRGALARGDYLRSAGRTTEAVEVWRALASDQATRGEVLGVDGPGRSVRLEALRRIAQMASRDTELAAVLESDARARLTVLGAAPEATREVAPEAAPPGQPPSPAQLIDFAIEFPRTTATVAAVVEATRNMAEVPAITALVSTLEECAIPPARVDLLPPLRAALAERLVDPAHRERVLARVDRRLAQLLVASGIETAPGTDRLPRVGNEPGVGLEIRAKIARFDAVGAAQRDPSLALAVLEGSLVRLSSETLAPEWRLRLDDRDPLVLWARDRVVVWQSSIGSGESASIIEPVGGTLVYSTPKAAALWLDGELPAGDQGASRGPNGEAFIPTQVVPVCDGESLVLVRRSGQIARFGVADEIPDPKTSRGILSKIYAVSLADGLLTIAGRSATGNSPTATVAVLDARTLEEFVRFQTATGEDVRWAFATALGEVFVGTATAVERWAIDATGVPRLAMLARGALSDETESPVLVGANLLTARPTGTVSLIPIFDGPIRMLEFPGAAEDGSRSVRALIPIPEGVVVHFSDRLMLVAPTGEIAGVDASARARNFGFAIATSGGILQVDGLGLADSDGVGNETRGEYISVIQNLSRRHGLRIEGRAFEVRCSGERFERATVLDGWMILSARNGSTAIPLPESGTTSPRGGVDSAE